MPVFGGWLRNVEDEGMPATFAYQRELMTAVRPNFRLPALVAKEAATIDQISNGRFTLNVVSAWWEEESSEYGGAWVKHDERYARTEEFLAVLKGMWTKDQYTLEGRYYTIKNARLAPKPVQKPWPVLYASYQDFIKGSQLETKVSLEDYSVSNRGLRTGLVGTPDQVAERVRGLEKIGIDLLLLQCSPQREEMQRFASEVFPLVAH